VEGYFFFLLGLCLLLTHEMDAVRVGEWGMFPFLSDLSEERGYAVFTAVHVPLYLLLFWSLLGGSDGINGGLVLVLDAFFVVHVLLHLLFVGHPNNRFKGAFSWVWILGAGVCGALDLGGRLL